MNILIVGGSGMIGSCLIQNLENCRVFVADLKESEFAEKSFVFDASKDWPKIEERFDVIVNLSGAPIFKPWTKDYKKIILDSRVGVSENILQFLRRNNSLNTRIVQASAMGFYGDCGSLEVGVDHLAGEGFLADVCSKWEGVLKNQDDLNNYVIVRNATVLGPGGFLNSLKPFLKLGIFPVYKMENYQAFVDIDDLVKIYKEQIFGNEIGVVHGQVWPSYNGYDMSRELPDFKIIESPKFLRGLIPARFKELGASVRSVPYDLGAKRPLNESFEKYLDN